MLNEQMQMTYQELEEVPRWGWLRGLNPVGHYAGNLFTYHPVNLFQKNDAGLYGIIRELNFPEKGQMTMWRLWNFNLETLEYDLNREEPRPNEYFYV
jgi:hypothetical protein